jgi:lysophospholipase L1-like esterase
MAAAMPRLSFALLVLLIAPAAQAQSRVFVVGDSHVFHLGRELNHQLEAAGFGAAGYESRIGWSSARYEREGELTELLIDRGKPEIVIVSLGGNDLAGSRDRYRAQLAAIVESVRAAGAEQIVWIGPAASDADVAAITAARHERNAELQRELLPSLGVAWIDSRPHTHEHHIHDGVHFTRDGYEVWACGVCGEVLAAIER